MITKETSKTASYHISIEAEEATRFTDDENRELNVAYKLLRIEAPYPIFVITAECGDEYDAVCITEGAAEAKKRFISVVRNTVTPCVLGEILRDMAY